MLCAQCLRAHRACLRAHRACEPCVMRAPLLAPLHPPTPLYAPSPPLTHLQVEVVEELLAYILQADYSMREDLVLKTAVLAER